MSATISIHTNTYMHVDIPNFIILKRQQPLGEIIQPFQAGDPFFNQDTNKWDCMIYVDVISYHSSVQNRANSLNDSSIQFNSILFI